MSLGNKLRKALGSALDKSVTSAKLTYLPTGIQIIDWALGGGFLEGRLTELIGESTVGKSLLMDVVLIQNQLRGGISVKFNNEEAHNPTFFRELGGDPEELIVRPEHPEELDEAPEPLYIENVFIEMEKVMLLQIQEGKGTGLAIGWDSIAATQAQAVATKTLEQVDMKYNLARAQAMANCVPRILNLARSSKAVVIASNQTRESPDPFQRQTRTPGGVTWGFCCSQRVELRKSNTIKSESGERMGHWAVGEVFKNRLAAALRVFRVPIYTRSDLPHPVFEGTLRPGIDRDEALWEFAMGKKGNGESETNYHPYFVLPDGKPVLTSEGKGWYKLHDFFGYDQKFRKSAWREILEKTPTIRSIPDIQNAQT